MPLLRKCCHAPRRDQIEQEHLLFQACKKIVVERSERLGKMLADYEGDINLPASIPLPLGILIGALFRRVDQFTPNLTWRTETWSWLVPVVGLVVVGVLLFALDESRAAEERVGFEAFLTLEETSIGKATRPTGALDARERAGSAHRGTRRSGRHGRR